MGRPGHPSRWSGLLPLTAEMRSTLGVLRGADEQLPRHPVAGLARLDDLVSLVCGVALGLGTAFGLLRYWWVAVN